MKLYFDYFSKLNEGKKPTKNIIKESKRTIVKKRRLTEGTSNFWTMDYFPLLVFEDIETADDQAREYALGELSEDEFDEMKEYDSEYDYPRFQELVDEYFDNYFGYVTLDEYDIDRLKEDIDQFNDSMKRKYYYNDDVEEGTKSVDGEEWDGVYPSVSIRSGYYEAYQLYVNVEPKSDVVQNYKYFLQEQIDEVDKFLNNMKKKYDLTQLGVSYRFSNGETGYHKL